MELPPTSSNYKNNVIITPTSSPTRPPCSDLELSDGVSQLTVPMQPIAMVGMEAEDEKDELTMMKSIPITNFIQNSPSELKLKSKTIPVPLPLPMPPSELDFYRQKYNIQKKKQKQRKSKPKQFMLIASLCMFCMLIAGMVVMHRDTNQDTMLNRALSVLYTPKSELLASRSQFREPTCIRFEQVLPWCVGLPGHHLSI